MSALIAIGDAQMAIADGTAPETWTRRRTEHWPAQRVVSGLPVRQHTGSEEALEVRGTAFYDVLDGVANPGVRLRELAEIAEPVDVVLGSGDVLGLFVVQSVSEEVERSWPNGQARRTVWTATLARVEPQVGADAQRPTQPPLQPVRGAR